MNVTMLRGYVYLAAMLCTMLSLFIPTSELLASGFIWLTALAAIAILSKRSRRQSIALISIGITGIVYARWHDASIPWEALLHSNTTLLAMLIAVSFLALVAAPTPTSRQRKLPTGNKGLASTLLANHLFGAVINVSSVIVIGERLKRYRNIDLPLASVLSLSFGLASLWSPFFAAMAYTLVLVPNMNLLMVMVIGAPTTLLGLTIIYWVNRKHNTGTYGYPVKGRSFFIPSVLAILVIIGHEVWPYISIPIIIIFAASILVLAVLILEKRIQDIHQHCLTRLAKFNNEAAIFLSAGVFSTGVGLFVDTLSWHLPFTGYGALEASLTLIMGMLAARMGVHAIIIMALFNPLIQPLNPSPNLLAATYLAIWGLGMTFNPVSGTLLTMQGQFNLHGNQLARHNTPWTVLLCLIVCCVFFVMGFIFD